MRISKDQKLISTLLSGKPPKKYEGKQVAVFEGKIYLLPDDDKKSGEFISKLIKEHPKSIPTITYVPKQGTYILLTKK